MESPHQTEKRKQSCMWGFISRLYFGQNHRKQKLLSNGKVSAKHVIGTKHPTKFDASTDFNQEIHGTEDGAELSPLAVHASDKRTKKLNQEQISSEMPKNNQMLATNDRHHELDSGLFDHRISKYRPPKKTTSENESPLYNWNDSETECSMSISKAKLACMLEEICNQINQENGDPQRNSTTHVKTDQLDEINLQILQTSAKTFIDQMFLDKKYIGKGEMSYESSEPFSDALEMLNSNGDLFLSLLRDPNSLLAKKIRNLQHVQMAKKTMKSLQNDKFQNGSSSESDTRKSETKQYRSSYSLEESSNTRPSNKIVVLKPTPRTLRCSENVSSHYSSMRCHHSSSGKGKNVKCKNYSLIGIKRKLKYAMGEKLKEQHWISIGSSLRKLHGNRKTLEVGNRQTDSRISTRGTINSFTESKTKYRTEKKQESVSADAPEVAFMTESYSKKGELDISMEAKKHISQRVRNVNTGEAVIGRQSSRTLARMLSPPERNLLVTYSPKRESGPNSAQMRFSPFGNCRVAEVEVHQDVICSAKDDLKCNDRCTLDYTSEPNKIEAITGVKSPQRDDYHEHLKSIGDSHLEVQSPVSLTDSYLSSPSSVYKLSVMDREEQPSPISVLEPVFSDDSASPCSIANQSAENMLQPRCIDFEEWSYKESPHSHTTYVPEQDALCIYIRSVLRAYDLNWEELWLNSAQPEITIDAVLINELELSGLECHYDPKLLMDYTTEVLLHAYDCHLRFPLSRNWPTSNEEYLVNKVMKEVNDVEILLMAQPTLEQLVGNDLAKHGSWLDIEKDGEDILVQITEYVLQESILDSVIQLYTSSQCS